MPLDIQTFSIVIGGSGCDAHCPFCVSKMTGLEEVRGCGHGRGAGDINWHNLAKAWRMAANGDTTTVLMTGKGEPLLYADEVTAYLRWFNQLYAKPGLKDPTDVNWRLAPSPMPLIELQTNALRIGDIADCANDPPFCAETPKWLEAEMAEYHKKSDGSQFHTYVTNLYRQLCKWNHLGLDTIAISCVGTDCGPDSLNAQVYRANYPDLTDTVRLLRSIGYTVRLCVMMMKGGVDSPEKLNQTIDWCRERDVAQLTCRAIRRPTTTKSDKASAFVEERGLTKADEDVLAGWVARNGQPVLRLAHGSTVYDIGGQNFCLADCLTENAEFNQGIRTLIFYSDGTVAYDWQHKGAKILSGWPREK